MPKLFTLRAAGVLSLGFACALAGCNSNSATPTVNQSQPTDAAKPQELSEMSALIGTWRLTQIEGKPANAGRETPLSPERAPHLVIGADGAVHGAAGVNRLSGKLDSAAAAKGEFHLGPVALTRMAGPADLMQLESDFTLRLDRADSYTVRGNTLALKAAGVELLRFERQVP